LQKKWGGMYQTQGKSVTAGNSRRRRGQRGKDSDHRELKLTVKCSWGREEKEKVSGQKKGQGKKRGMLWKRATVKDRKILDQRRVVTRERRRPQSINMKTKKSARENFWQLKKISHGHMVCGRRAGLQMKRGKGGGEGEVRLVAIT